MIKGNRCRRRGRLSVYRDPRIGDVGDRRVALLADIHAIGAVPFDDPVGARFEVIEQPVDLGLEFRFGQPRGAGRRSEGEAERQPGCRRSELNEHFPVPSSCGAARVAFSV
jgi:hypothetical protein